MSISPSRSLFMANAWSAEGKVYKFDVKKGKVSFEKIMIFSGHKKHIICATFDHTDKLALTISDDNHFILWNIDVRYEVNENPRTLLSMTPQDLKVKGNLENGALYSDEETNLIALCISHNIYVYNFPKINLVCKIEDVFETNIKKIYFDKYKENIILACIAEKNSRLFVFKIPNV